MEWLQSGWTLVVEKFYWCLDKLNTLPAYVSAIIVIIIIFLSFNFLPVVFKVVRTVFKFLFGWMGRIAVINAVSSFFFSRDSLIVKTIRAAFLAVSTFIASISGYTRGYKQGYKDGYKKGTGREIDGPGFWASLRSIWLGFRNK